MIKQFLDFIKYYGKNKKSKIMSFLMISILAGGLEFVGIGLIYPFLMMIINPLSFINTRFFNEFTRIFGIHNLFVSILIVGFVIVMMFLAKNLLMIFCVYVQNKFVINWKNDIKII